MEEIKREIVRSFAEGYISAQKRDTLLLLASTAEYDPKTAPEVTAAIAASLLGLTPKS